MGNRDGPRAWIVAISACMLNFIMAGLGRMGGILFVAFIETYKVDRQRALMPFIVRSSAKNLFGPVVGILGQKYGARNVIVFGCIIGTVSAVLCYYTPNIMWITVFWGGMNGLAAAMTVTLPQVVIGEYFSKHRTTAAGLAFSGGCVGSFLFPVVLEYVLQKLGIEGTFLVMGLIIMPTVPVAFLLKKPPWLKSGRLKESLPIQDKSRAEERNNLMENKSFEKLSEIELCTKNEHQINTFSVHSVNDYKSETTIKSSSKNLEISSDSDIFTQNGAAGKIFVLGESTRNDDKVGTFGFDEFSEFYKSMSQTEKNIYSVVDVKNDKYSKYPEMDSKHSMVRNRSCLEFSRNRVEPVILRRASDFQGQNFLANTFTVSNKVNNIQASDYNHLRISYSNQVAIKLEFRRNRSFSESPLDSYKPLIRKKLSECSKIVAPKFLNDSLEIKAGHDGDSNSFTSHIKTAFHLHTNVLYLMVSLCRAIHFFTFIPTMTTVVDFAMDRGLHEEDGKFTIAAISVGDLLGRLCFGWITDHEFVSLSRYMIFAMIVQGLSTASLPLMKTKLAIFADLALFGLLQGALFVRHPVLISKYIKAEEQSIAIGCMNFLSGIIGLGLPAYIGYFRDTLGSYDYIFYWNGLLASCIGLMWFFEPLLVTKKK